MRKNYVLFIVLSIGILLGWLWLEGRFGPGRPHKDGPPKAATAAQKQAARVSGLVGTPATSLTPMLDALSAAGALLDSADHSLVEVPAAVAPTMSTALRAELGPVGIALVPPHGVGGWLLLADLMDKVRPAEPPPEKAETVALGGDDYYLKATLTSRGGGVRSVTLTKFHAADREGLPVYNEVAGKKVPAPLELVRDDPVAPSFLFYHYATPEAPRPVDTLGNVFWKMERLSKPGDKTQQVRFTAKVPGYPYLTIRRTYSLAPGDYHLGLTIEMTDERPAGQANQEDLKFRYQLAGAHGLPIEGEWYTYTYRNSMIGMVDSQGDLVRTLEDSRQIALKDGGERVPEQVSESSYLQYAAVTIQYFASAIVVDDKQPSAEQGGEDFKKILAWARPTHETTELRGRLRELIPQTKEVVVMPVGTTGKASLVQLLDRAWDQLEQLKLQPNEEVFLSVHESEGKRFAESIRRGSAPRPFLDDLTVRVNSVEVDLKPGTTRVHRFLLYHGPLKIRQLSQFSGDRAVDDKLVDRYADTLHLRTFTDYRSDNFFGKISQTIHLTDLLIFCTTCMHALLGFLRWIVPNEGLSIVLLTVIVRGAMFPISRKQALISMRMQALAPEMKKLQEKYKNDPQAKTQATMELYRTHGVNPLGGCLPLLLQMPIFLGLYWALQESITFRLAGFLWIENLAAPDMLFRWGDWIPMVSNPDNMGGFLYLGPFFNVLPVAAVVLMQVQQAIMMPPAADEQQAAQQKMMKIMMVVFGLMFYKVAAGLCIYFIASSMWGLAERKLLPKKKPVVGGGATPGGGSGGPPGGGKGPSGGKGPGGRGKGRGPKKTEDSRFGKVRDWWHEILKQAEKK